MLRFGCVMFALFAALVALPGCGNPMKRPPANVFPGSDHYNTRVKSLKISPAQAYDLAHEAAVADGKLQFLSRRPTVIVKRSYVFSMPQPTGATMQGYHVNGDTGAVKFVNDKKVVPNK